MKVGVLFVSTGGICRAPMAAGVFRTFARRGRVEDMFDIAAVATFDGHVGLPPSLLAREVSHHRGYDLGNDPVRVIQPADILHHAHLLATDRTVLAALRWMAPAGHVDRPQLLMRHAPQMTASDIADPYGGTAADFERALDLIEKGCAGFMMNVMTRLKGPMAGSAT